MCHRIKQHKTTASRYETDSFTLISTYLDAVINTFTGYLELKAAQKAILSNIRKYKTQNEANTEGSKQTVLL